MKKEILLQTTSTWDKKGYEKVCINNPEVTVLSIKIGVGEALEMHKHDLVNVAYVKSGTLTVTTDKNEQIKVPEGHALPEIMGAYHYGKNESDVPVELIVFYIGEKGTPLSVSAK